MAMGDVASVVFVVVRVSVDNVGVVATGKRERGASSLVVVTTQLSYTAT